MTTTTNTPVRLLVLFGTRPEAIKLAPVIWAAQAMPEQWAVEICATGQHDELLQQVLDVFQLRPHYDLGVMRPGQSLSELTARLLEALPSVLATSHPDVVVVQGDTTTAFCAALAAFYHRIAVAHVEAGLRTHNLAAPFPEELNRRLIGQIATWHFAPTPKAAQNLLREGAPRERVHVVGNTVVDAVRLILELQRETERTAERPFVLVTHHRRESFVHGIRKVFQALRVLASRYPEVDFVFPMHPNPHVREAASELLARLANLKLLDPLPYPAFLMYLARAAFIITDSGGIQEEATVLGKRVLVTRETTEREEAVEAGFAQLVGLDTDRLVAAAEQLLTQSLRETPTSLQLEFSSPFGDGHAAERILATLYKDLPQVL